MKRVTGEEGRGEMLRESREPARGGGGRGGPAMLHARFPALGEDEREWRDGGDCSRGWKIQGWGSISKRDGVGIFLSSRG